MVFRIPKTTFRFHDSLERFTGPNNVFFMAVIYYNERMHNNIRNGKSTWIKVQEKPDANFQESSPSGITKNGLNPATSCDNVGEVLSIKKLVRDSVLKISRGLLVI